MSARHEIDLSEADDYMYGDLTGDGEGDGFNFKLEIDDVVIILNANQVSRLKVYINNFEQTLAGD